MHIAIAGNIGSGKTTLTKMLAAHYGWTPKFESVDYNPYLADFYEDMERWSFNLQVYFLNKRFKDVVDISKEDNVIIQDRTIYEDARIFAPNLHGMGLMSTRDFENYSDLFDLVQILDPGDQLVFLLLGHILCAVANLLHTLLVGHAVGLGAQRILAVHGQGLAILQIHFHDGVVDCSHIELARLHGLSNKIGQHPVSNLQSSDLCKSARDRHTQRKGVRHT